MDKSNTFSTVAMKTAHQWRILKVPKSVMFLFRPRSIHFCQNILMLSRDQVIKVYENDNKITLLKYPVFNRFRRDFFMQHIYV